MTAPAILNAQGRRTLAWLVNKSGGDVALGDVVVLDTANDEAFTTTTSAADVKVVGVVVEENGIASNATGRVALSGYVSLINVNAAVTRGDYGGTHTVAKQSASLGASRATGSFCQYTTGGTTPSALLFGITDGSATGTSFATPALTLSTANASGAASTALRSDATIALFDATAPTTSAAGDAAAAGTAGVAARRDHAHGREASLVPPGHEYDYVPFTANVSPTATTEATANTVVTGNAVAYDGATTVMIEFFSSIVRANLTAGATMTFCLYDGAASIGFIAAVGNPSTSAGYSVVRASQRLTPSNASHTYSIRAFVSGGTGIVGAGVGGVGATVPGYIRQNEGLI